VASLERMRRLGTVGEGKSRGQLTQNMAVQTGILCSLYAEFVASYSVLSLQLSDDVGTL